MARKAPPIETLQDLAKQHANGAALTAPKSRKRWQITTRGIFYTMTFVGIYMSIADAISDTSGSLRAQIVQPLVCLLALAVIAGFWSDAIASLKGFFVESWTAIWHRLKRRAP